MITRFIRCCLLALLFAAPAQAKIFSKAHPFEQTVHKKFNLKAPGTLIIENIDGSINIKTEWNQNSIGLVAVKRASKEEELHEIDIDDTMNGDTLTLRTKYDQREVKGSVDYTLVIPANIGLKLMTGDGMITINQVHGSIMAMTRNGDIEINSPKGTLDVIAKKTGSITIHQPSDNVQATTAKGNITIYDAQKTVVATAENGSIELHSKKVPSTSKLALKTGTGSIELYLPHETNAEVKARTEKGNLMCEHMITVKPFTTQINAQAWKRLQKEIEGTLGSGEASIALQSKNGSIKIMELTA